MPSGGELWVFCFSGSSWWSFLAACWPISDPLARYHMAHRTSRPELVEASEQYFGTEHVMREGNPYYMLLRGEATHLPPALIVQGTEDANAPLDMQERFVRAYARAGGQIEMMVCQGMPHMFITMDPTQPEAVRAIDRIVRFVKAQSSSE